jgi:hypothetical protein
MQTASFHVSRRQSIAGLSLLGLGGLLVPSARAQQNQESAGAEPAKAENIKDEDIFRFALNLEYMEAEYYLRGLTGHGISDDDAGKNPGKVVGGHAVQFGFPAVREFLEEVAENELAHVRFYRKTLGEGAVDRPAIDFNAGFKAAAEAAGLGPNFDVFANDMTFLLGGMLFEDVGVTAYAGAARHIQNKDFLDAAAGILACEAYHMGMARSQLYRMGEAAWKAANAVSDARSKLDGPGKDQGIYMNGKANVVPTNTDAICFRRTPQEVLHIVYLTEKAGVSQGGFYPNGMNGTLRTT